MSCPTLPGVVEAPVCRFEGGESLPNEEHLGVDRQRPELGVDEGLQRDAHWGDGGVEELCKRASNDAVGQAYSGTLSFNGTSEEPYLVKPFNNDYITALTAAFGALSAYIHAEKTGEGQIVDVTQFEAQARVMNDLFVNYTELGLIKKPAPYPIQPAGIFMTKDKFVSLALLGKSQFYKGLEIFGFDPEYFTFEEVAFGPSLFSEKGKEFDQKFREWCKNHTAEEIVD